MAKKKIINYDGERPVNLDDSPFFGYQLDEHQLDFANSIWNPDKLIVFCNAKAGSGKTLIATGVAEMLVKYGLYDGIVYIMSPYGEKRQGYLPGSITEKSEVYFEPFYAAMISCGINPNIAINDDSMVNQKNGDGYITCLTHTFLRGCNFENKVVILDESQNYTVDELQKTLTRCHDSCKVIVIGHTGQIDIDNPRLSGFARAIDLFSPDDRTAICELKTNYRGWISQTADLM